MHLFKWILPLKPDCLDDAEYCFEYSCSFFASATIADLVYDDCFSDGTLCAIVRRRNCGVGDEVEEVAPVLFADAVSECADAFVLEM